MTWTPHKTALAVVWAVLAVWSTLAYITLGADWWIPTMYPALVGIVMTVLIIRWERGAFRTIRDQRREDQKTAANLPHRPGRGE